MSDNLPSNWRNRIVKLGVKRASEFQAHPLNWRTHPESQKRALSASLSEVGWVTVVIENIRTGHLIDGHERVQQALEEGDLEVPYIQVDLSEEEEKLVLASLDPLAALAGIEPVQLEALLSEVQPQAEALQELFNDLLSEAQIDLSSELRKVLPPEPRLDRSVELQAKWHTAPGQLWTIPSSSLPGRQHRILCADCTVPLSVAYLMEGQRAKMVFTDPPWNVAIGRDSNPRHRQRPGLQNDTMPREEFRAFLAAFVRAISPYLAGDIYCVLGASEWSLLDEVLRTAGYHWSATIVWVKDTFVLGRSNYHRRYEPIWYGWQEGKKSSYVGGRAQDDVWEFKRPYNSELHPTMKPIELVEKAILNSSLLGDIILDPFLGSGTTCLAAERVRRLGFGIEIDPRFVAVSLERLSELGLEPRLTEVFQETSGQNKSEHGA